MRPDYVHCIAHDHVDTPTKTWCGRERAAWNFVSIDHAALNGEQSGRLVACAECVAAVVAALANGQADAAHDSLRTAGL